MSILILYIATAVIFLTADALMLRSVIKPVFERHLGDQLLDSPRILPAVGFYLFYVAGVVWFAGLPAWLQDSPRIALGNGMLLGALAYGTYEFTNWATLRAWSPQQVALDFVWGTILTGLSAWLGVLIVRALMS
jgi:uncharacterized membrane protein